MKYLIRYSGPQSDFACDDDGRPLYWSNADGWVSRETADAWTDEDRDIGGIFLPMEVDENDDVVVVGEWVDFSG